MSARPIITRARWTLTVRVCTTGRYPNDEAALRAVLTALSGHGRVLVVIDQVASLGALIVAVAREMKIDIAYLPGLSMRRIADLHPGEAKTDARDAWIIADAARTMPHTLRRVRDEENLLAGLAVLAGYDQDLAAQSTRLSNRLRDALLHLHPALERLLRKHLDRGGVIDLLKDMTAEDVTFALLGSCLNIPTLRQASQPQIMRRGRGGGRWWGG